MCVGKLCITVPSIRSVCKGEIECVCSLTDAIFGAIVFFSELVTIAEKKATPPQVDHTSNCEVAVPVVVSCNRTGLE